MREMNLDKYWLMHYIAIVCGFVCNRLNSGCLMNKMGHKARSGKNCWGPSKPAEFLVNLLWIVFLAGIERFMERKVYLINRGGRGMKLLN